MKGKGSSVGVVSPKTAHLKKSLRLECGKSLGEFDMVFETYGQLNREKSNAILICHALSGNHHAAGFHEEFEKKAGWWDALIGPDKAIDTNLYFVVSPNNLGGCHGTTGPKSVNPKTGEVIPVSKRRVVTFRTGNKLKQLIDRYTQEVLPKGKGKGKKSDND